MARIKMFIYKFSDGSTECMEPLEAIKHCNKNNLSITSNGYLKHMDAPVVKRVRDRDMSNVSSKNEFGPSVVPRKKQSTLDGEMKSMLHEEGLSTREIDAVDAGNKI